MKRIIAEARLVQSRSHPHIFHVDDGERGIYLDLTGSRHTRRSLDPHLGQIVTVSVEVPEETACCSPDFEKRVLEIIRDTLKKAL